MVELLAFIAIIIILWWCSKQLKRLGNWLQVASYEIADYRAAMRKKVVEENKVLRQQNRKTAEVVQAIKGGQSNVVYTDQVRAEIDELEREINSND